ncbi:lipopolysaccharide transport periplasmic protein LptA [Paenalcaligenes niemegkensis]|uniref:lipopolysaccharide transport periplasmic protein LptA n=1 Tax=Paenalcaligenes niemegkensis TaxID=2895469 RepID=UPI001EE7F954|nr:lipopolysaccharide transport periplasmic protein LptA [Paenalcaligenes niemegkensis]MCQ9615563.1 lipopolysaccharide transport periplasmic protein LptA [Paenalcaligenes niemegkensis]
MNLAPSLSTLTSRLPRSGWSKLCVVLALGLSCAGLSAQSTEPEVEPDTLILSDTLHYDDVKKESVFEGNVIMTRGMLILNSDHLTMREDAEGFQYGTATVSKTDRVRVRQEKPEKHEVVKAEGLRAEYNSKTDELIMIGQAIITRYVCGKPFDNIQGDRVIYHQDTDTYEAFGGAQSAAANQRVRSVARPRAKADAALAECENKSGQAASSAQP